ncbi:uncharacterized protein LOC126883666 [Diabrotica virgifera virgifera]|uniref:Uncharacterized protein n=1 Tax=Diabrotica virgifera virgifera TaxID=50390 RepID=A0ABM5K520_DIAVI|nr:uncharacterized protein LOC126883666 [Diabrotica virgifera virgifera]
MTEEVIKALNVKRGNAKRSLAIYENFLNKYNPEKDFLSLEKRYQDIEKVRENFEIVQTELEILQKESDELTNYRLEFEEQYYKTYAIATNFLSDRITEKFKSSTLDNTPPEPIFFSVASSSSSAANNFATNFPAASLASIPLPIFSGTIDTWIGFFDLFNSLVHEDNNIPPVRKLFYLKSCLTGEAADIITSIESSAQNYDVAWNLLKERYDDRKFIRDSYIKSLIDTPCVSKEFSTHAFLDHIQKYLRALKNLGEPIDSWDSFLVILLKYKFTNSLRERWEDHSNESRIPTMKQIMSFLNRKAQLENTRSQQSSIKKLSTK